jgi:hypothetical protein
MPDSGEFGLFGIIPLVELDNRIVFIRGKHERQVSVTPPAHEHSFLGFPVLFPAQPKPKSFRFNPIPNVLNVPGW